MNQHPFLAWQIPEMLWLQKFGALHQFFDVASFVGSEQFFLLLVPLFYICIDRKVGVRLAMVLLLSESVNLILKLAFAMPRPTWISSDVYTSVPEPSFGLPSSHAQNAVAVWFYLTSLQTAPWRRTLALVAAAAVVVAISASRVYLAVHFPSDVIAGAVVGAVVLAGFMRWHEQCEFWLRQLSPRQQAATCCLALLLPVLATVLAARVSVQSLHDAAAVAAGIEAACGRAGAIFGIAIGVVLATRSAGFRPALRKWQRWASGFVVAVGVLICWIGLASVLPAGHGSAALVVRLLRYAAIGLWVVYIAPMLLLRLGLLSPVTPDETRRA